MSYWFFWIFLKKYFWVISPSLLLGCMYCKTISQFATFFFQLCLWHLLRKKVVNFCLTKYIKFFIILSVKKSFLSPSNKCILPFFPQIWKICLLYLTLNDSKTMVCTLNLFTEFLCLCSRHPIAPNCPHVSWGVLQQICTNMTTTWHSELPILHYGTDLKAQSPNVTGWLLRKHQLSISSILKVAC